jgi:hypothetical protein
MKPGEKPVVFLGPALDGAEASDIFDADYRAPAKMGDIYAVLGSGVRLVVLIDGVGFGSGAPPWQRELVAALDDGIAVVGGAGIGAVRAAELHSVGMHGVGTIFEWFRSGAIEGDDEVAVPEHDALRLVDVRWALTQSFGARDAEPLIRWVQQMSVGERTRSSIVAVARQLGWSDAKRETLEQIFDEGASLTKADARATLLAARALSESTMARASAPAPDRFEHVKLEHRELAYGVRGADLLAALRLETVRTERAELRERVVRRWFVTRWARERGVVAENCRETLEARYPRRRTHGMSEREYLAALDDIALESAVLATETSSEVIADWARSHGIQQAESAESASSTACANWVIERTPSFFGYPFRLDVAMFRELQLLGELDGLGAAP